MNFYCWTRSGSNIDFQLLVSKGLRQSRRHFVRKNCHVCPKKLSGKPGNTCRIRFSGKLCFRSQIANHQKYLSTFYSPKNMFRNFIPVNPKFNQFGKWEPVQTLQRFDKNSPFQKNMTVYSRKAVRKWNILTTSKSQNWLQEFQQYCEKIKLKQRAFE